MDLTNPYESPLGDEMSSSPELPPGARLVDEIPIPSGAVSAEFHLVREDFERWMQHWKSRNPTSSIIGSPTLGLLLVLLVSVILAGFLTGGWLVAGPFIGVIAGLLILWIGVQRSLKWNELQYPGGVNFDQPELALTLWHRVTLLPEYLVLSTGLDQTLYRWRRFTDVQDAAHAVYLVDNQLTTHLIPRRAFANDADFARFVETARRFQQLANPVADRDIAQLPSKAAG